MVGLIEVLSSKRLVLFPEVPLEILYLSTRKIWNVCCVLNSATFPVPLDLGQIVSFNTHFEFAQQFSKLTNPLQQRALNLFQNSFSSVNLSKLKKRGNLA